MHHKIRIEDAQYQAIADGRKRFLIAGNNPGYNAGDTFSFKDAIGEKDREGTFLITYVTNRGQTGDNIVMSFRAQSEETGGKSGHDYSSL